MHVLGIDAGGTKTVCVLADGAGRTLAEARGGGANLQVDGELGVEKVLHAVMDQATAGHEAGIDAVCLGMAGVDRDVDGVVVRGIMRRIAARSRVAVVNDALIALVAGVGEEPGVVIVSGTGSIAYGRSGTRAARAGGWGHVLGDEGSGYAIGREALRAVVRGSDGRGPATLLAPRVLRHFSAPQAIDLIGVVYDRQLRHHALARVAQFVQQARDEGDEVATEILETAAHELVRAARSVVERLHLAQEAFSFVLSGGVFTGVPWLANELHRRLPGLAARATVRRLDVEPAQGAVALALLAARGKLELPSYVS